MSPFMLPFPFSWPLLFVFSSWLFLEPLVRCESKLGERVLLLAATGLRLLLRLGDRVALFEWRLKLEYNKCTVINNNKNLKKIGYSSEINCRIVDIVFFVSFRIIILFMPWKFFLQILIQNVETVLKVLLIPKSFGYEHFEHTFFLF